MNKFKRKMQLIRNSVLGAMVVVFSLSPFAFGAAVPAEQIYKDLYVSMKRGEDTTVWVNRFLAAVRDNKLDVKSVFEAAVAKKFMAQEQLDSLLALAQENSAVSKDPALLSKASAANFSASDVQSISNILNSQASGATYYCGYYGCYRAVAVVPLSILVLLLLCSPAFFIVY